MPPGVRPRVQRAGHAALKALRRGPGLWALADQGVASLGTFATGIVLARRMPPETYGAYALILSAILFLNSLQSSLVIYPLVVRGAKTDQSGLRRLLSGSLILTAIMLVPQAGLLAGGVALAGLRSAALPAVAALAAWQLQETLRRALTAHLRYREAVWGDAITYLGQAALVWAAVRGLDLSLSRALCIMAIAAAAGLALQTVQLGQGRLGWGELRAWIGTCWQLGRWTLLASFMTILIGSATSWALMLFHGLAVVGVAQSMGNIIRFANPIHICVMGLVLPAAASAWHEQGTAAAGRVALRYGVLGAAIIFPLYGLVFLWPSQAVSLFYGPNSPYHGYESYLRWVIAAQPFAYGAGILATLINATERSRLTFMAQVAAALATLMLVVPFTARYGLIGNACGCFAVAVVWVAASLHLLRRLGKDSAGSHGKPPGDSGLAAVAASAGAGRSQRPLVLAAPAVQRTDAPSRASLP